jgi:hypothetical protein
VRPVGFGKIFGLFRGATGGFGESDIVPIAVSKISAIVDLWLKLRLLND